VTRDEYLTGLRDNAAAFVAAVEGADLDATVPSCPDWKLRDLAVHLGGHYRWVRGNVGRSQEDGPQPRAELGDPPADDAVAGWVGEGAAALVATLEQTDVDAPCWTFFGPSRAGFWFRRTAHESAMHRWDAQHALGDADPIGPLAVDGIDEWLGLLAVIRGEGLARPEPVTVHLHCTDEPGEWLLALGPDGMTVTPEHAKGDAAVRGTASDLLLLLLGRASATDVEVFGDALVLDGFLAQSSF
jgi:uncharacterized protein (TIGR03083 family)